jgi:hypothetical protein
MLAYKRIEAPRNKLRGMRSLFSSRKKRFEIVLNFGISSCFTKVTFLMMRAATVNEHLKHKKKRRVMSMITRKSLKCSILIGLVFFVAYCFIGSGPANAWSIYRHIYNKSPDMIEFYVDAAQGNVYFIEGPCNVKNGPCTLPPNTTQKIKFTETNGEAKGHINISCKSCRDPIPVRVGYIIWSPFGENYNMRKAKGGDCGETPSCSIWYYFNQPAVLDITVRPE